MLGTNDRTRPTGDKVRNASSCVDIRQSRSEALTHAIAESSVPLGFTLADGPKTLGVKGKFQSLGSLVGCVLDSLRSVGEPWAVVGNLERTLKLSAESC